jgi:Protein of unknown function (DUF2950)
MNPTFDIQGGSGKSGWASAAGALLLAVAFGLPLSAQAQAPFAKPEQVADALINALATNDEAALTRLFGSGWRQLMNLDEASAEDRYTFLQKASQARAVSVKDGRAELTVGTDPWTLPVPIVQGKDGQWRFDPVAGRDAIAVRRIGANERAAMQASLAYVDAQREYAQADRNGDGFVEYAQKLMSSPGQRDGLYWSPSLGGDSPLGASFLPKRPGEGYHGYRFKILTEQGPAARGGARSYFIGKRMASGFALVAWPVQYGKTGVMSFMVNQDGVLFERDLGPQSAQAASALKSFNPAEPWKKTQP